MLRSINAGACAPSIIQNRLCFLAKALIFFAGKIIAVELVIWLAKIILVLLVIFASNLSMKSSSDKKGRGISVWIYFAPVFLHINFHVLSKAPYSWLVVKISSFFLNLNF